MNSKIISTARPPETHGETPALLEGEREMLNTADVGRILGVTQQVVRNLCRSGKLPSVHIGQRVYVPRAELVRQIREGLSESGKETRHE